VFNNGYLLQNFNLTIAEILRRYGYFTEAIISNPGLTSRFNFHQGFDRYQRTSTLNDVLGEELLESRHLNDVILPTLDDVKRRAIADRRFFLWIHYRDPHTPYLVPEDYKDLFTGDALAKAHGGREIPVGDNAPYGEMSPQEVVYGSQDLDFLVAQYDAEIRFNDDSIARVLDKMDELGLSRNTLLIVTADHGESLWEHGYIFDHGNTAYETQARVPLIFYHPRLPSGLVVEETVSLVDVLPTVLDLLGLPIPPTVQGESFAPALLGHERIRKRGYHFIIGSYRRGYQTHAVATDTHKMILDVDERWLAFDATVERAARLWSGGDELSRYRARKMNRELYDLTTDPAEEKNLSGRVPAVEDRLEKTLWEWMEATYREGRSRQTILGEIDEETRKALEALGYVELGDQ
jgi:arylsulfatase A-like enzyme